MSCQPVPEDRPVRLAIANEPGEQPSTNPHVIGSSETGDRGILEILNHQNSLVDGNAGGFFVAEEILSAKQSHLILLRIQDAGALKAEWGVGRNGRIPCVLQESGPDRVVLQGEREPQ